MKMADSNFASGTSARFKKTNQLTNLLYFDVGWESIDDHGHGYVVDPVGKVENYPGQNHLILCYCEHKWMEKLSLACEVWCEYFTVHLFQGQLTHVVKYRNRRYFLHLMMIQILPPGLKQILNFFIGLGLKFFDVKKITIRKLHQNLLTPGVFKVYKGMSQL